ncbi:hypothetical protein B8Y17_004029 [Salmonella enterica subsp. enterica serovar Sandiego]|uniref:hypothetical protein n=1 Tax=Salmonella enterica TaxID=28901 RepID=UPI0017E6CB62|nr:hypothetical protein [Salmonella enterica]EAT8236790.1 hypothetical protein [Salmonella enterica]EDT4894441.1 hypothetical protein [Salmonella enterica subsp. enterica serovar Sandiego]EEJ7304606.1 hypothetical protein [Salmonella enterica subsp. enterica]
MITITKERLLTIKQWRETYGPGSNVVLPAEEAEELARIALASLAAVSDERAAYELFMEKRFGESVDRRRAKNGDCEYMAWDMALGWIIWCHRTAMLQGNQPVSQTYKFPQTQFEQVADLYEMQFDDGRTCAFHSDVQKAAQWLQACDGNRVQEYVKLERLQNALSDNSPVTPDGWVIVPKKLTAENGAKGVLSGEFSETTFISCPECFGDDDCDTCDGSGRIEIKVPVTWTTIKSIWDKGIAHFAAKPPQEVNRG